MMAATTAAANSLPGPSTPTRERPQHLQAVSRGAQHGPDARRKHRKYRYRGQGYHKNERENSRRVEARRFLSGITLDSHLRPIEILQDKEAALQQNISTISLEEGGTKPNSNAPKLHEMAVNWIEQYSRHSPVKMALSRSHELNFEGSPFNPTTPVGRSLSVVEQALTPLGQDQKRTTFQLMPHSRSMGSSVEGGNMHYHTSDMKFPSVSLNANTRFMFVCSGAPFSTFSVMPYMKHEAKFKVSEHPQRQRARINSTSLHHLDLDVQLGTSEEVSLAHLLEPVGKLWTEEDSKAFGLPSTPSGHPQDPTQQATRVFRLDASYSQVLEHPTPSASGSTFPWARFKEHHDTERVLMYYHPLCMDNYQYFVGPNISTLSVPGYRVSIIQYAKASEQKRGINGQFSDVFPHLKISLSKLRSIKKEIHSIAKDHDLDLAVVAHAYVYYEKLVLMGKVNKSNRKLLAGVCLLLAAKFFMDMKKQEVKDLLEEISDTFRVSCEDVVACELPVLASLQFSLLTPIFQTLTHYERLRDR